MPALLNSPPRHHVRLFEQHDVYADPLYPGRPAATETLKDLVNRRIRESVKHFLEPTSRRQPRMEDLFTESKARWKEETAVLSSVSEMAMHPDYQRIIGLGPEVVPLLLRELEKEPDHWFWALKAVTGVDPVSPDQRGRVREMAACWIRWGKEQGKI